MVICLTNNLNKSSKEPVGCVCEKAFFRKRNNKLNDKIKTQNELKVSEANAKKSDGPYMTWSREGLPY